MKVAQGATVSSLDQHQSVATFRKEAKRTSREPTSEDEPERSIERTVAERSGQSGVLLSNRPGDRAGDREPNYGDDEHDQNDPAAKRLEQHERRAKEQAKERLPEEYFGVFQATIQGLREVPGVERADRRRGAGEPDTDRG